MPEPSIMMLIGRSDLDGVIGGDGLPDSRQGPTVHQIELDEAPHRFDCLASPYRHDPASANRGDELRVVQRSNASFPSVDRASRAVARYRFPNRFVICLLACCRLFGGFGPAWQ